MKKALILKYQCSTAELSAVGALCAISPFLAALLIFISVEKKSLTESLKKWGKYYIRAVVILSAISLVFTVATSENLQLLNILVRIIIFSGSCALFIAYVVADIHQKKSKSVCPPNRDSED